MSRLVVNSLKKEVESKRNILINLKEDYARFNELDKKLKDGLLLIKACIEEASKNREYIEQLVTEGLQYIFEEPYDFKFVTILDSATSEVKGIKPTIFIDNQEVSDIEKTLGSGVADTTDILTHLACLSVQNSTRKLYIGDEILNSLSSYRFSRFGEYLLEFCPGAGLQVILNTHHSTAFGKIYKVEKINGVSNVTEV